jgi:hypothetical protein
MCGSVVIKWKMSRTILCNRDRIMLTFTDGAKNVKPEGLWRGIMKKNVWVSWGGSRHDGLVWQNYKRKFLVYIWFMENYTHLPSGLCKYNGHPFYFLNCQQQLLPLYLHPISLVSLSNIRFHSMKPLHTWKLHESIRR